MHRDMQRRSHETDGAGTRRWPKIFGVGVWLAGALVLGVPAALYLPVAETWSARCVIVVVLLGLAAAALARRRRWRWTGPMIVGAAAAGAIALAQTPSDDAPRSGRAGPRVESRFTSAHPYRRFAIANVVPEIDQMKLGSYLVPASDPFLTVASSARLRALFLDVYRDMGDDPAFLSLPSSMPYAYDDADSGHLYTYVPAHAAGERLGVLLFLHGSGGNFQVYTHLLAAVAERAHVMVVAPSFGFGNWHHRGGTEAIEAAARYAVEQLDGDASRIVLMGLSNGGRGVTRALRDGAQRYAGVVLLSAVMETDVVRGVGGRYAGTPALVIYGDADDRLPAEHEEAGASALRAAGLAVRVHAYPREDHFLFFAQKTSVQDETAAFVGRALGPATARP